MKTIVASMIVMVACVQGHLAQADSYYVAPLGAVPAAVPDGSLARPFASVDTALRSGKVKGGDTVLLMDGNHGGLALYKVAFDSPVTITSQNGKQAHLDWISIRGASANLTFDKLSIWPTDVATTTVRNLVEMQGEASKIVFQNLDIRSDANATNYLQWDAATWNARVFNGINIGGAGGIARANQLTGVYMGITLNGNGSMALDNIIEGFNGDGLRPLGNDTILRGNLVKNCVDTDGNHDDGIQGFKSGGGTISGVVIDRNTILEWTAAADHPLRCALQGIFLSDATYENLTLTNNLVSTSQYHGITLSGGQNSRIVNNTVVNAKGVTSPYPWLKIWDTPLPVNVLVANNLAMSISSPAAAGSALTFRNNSVIGTPGAVFENPFAFDYRPNDRSGFIDTGDAASAPATDILGKPRPLGNGPDRGAYEVGEVVDPLAPSAPQEGTAPSEDELSSGEPVVTEPVVTDPVVVDPVVTEPVVTEPVVTEPVVTEPVLTAPVVTDPIATEPISKKGPGKPVGRWASDPLTRKSR